MIPNYERDDIVRIMKMNRFALTASDTAHLEFSDQNSGQSYKVSILVSDNCPTINIRKDDRLIYGDTLKSIDDLKIFLEEQLYKYLK